jgi:hypothetical protein
LPRRPCCSYRGGGFYLVFLKPAAPGYTSPSSGPLAGVGGALTVLGTVYGLIRESMEIGKMPKGSDGLALRATDVGACKVRLAGAGWVAAQGTVILPSGLVRYRVTAERGDRSVIAEEGDLPGAWRQAARLAEAEGRTGKG